MNKTIKPLCLAGLVAVSPAALSDTVLGIYAGGGVWQTDFSGQVGDMGQPAADLEDLGLRDEDNQFYFVALEHPVPLLPNIRLQHTGISLASTSDIDQTFVIDDVTYTANTTVTSDIDFSHTDATLYYEVLDNWANLDLGLTFRKFDGDISLRTDSLSGSQALDETIPMVYAKAQFNLPLTGFFLGAAGNYASHSGSKVSDLQASLGYMSDGLVLDFGIEVGVRSFAIELDDVSELDADMKLEGTFASIYLHF
jgi:outer membrane protein